MKSLSPLLIPSLLFGVTLAGRYGDLVQDRGIEVSQECVNATDALYENNPELERLYDATQNEIREFFSQANVAGEFCEINVVDRTVNCTISADTNDYESYQQYIQVCNDDPNGMLFRTAGASTIKCQGTVTDGVQVEIQISVLNGESQCIANVCDLKEMADKFSGVMEQVELEMEAALGIQCETLSSQETDNPTDGTDNDQDTSSANKVVSVSFGSICPLVSFFAIGLLL